MAIQAHQSALFIAWQLYQRQQNFKPRKQIIITTYNDKAET